MDCQDALLIRRPNDLDARWLEDILASGGTRARISGIKSEPVGTGQLGDTIRIFIDSEDGDAPSSVIAKFPAESEISRSLAKGWRLYRREIGFYTDLAKAAKVTTPRCFSAVIDEKDEFVLVLEDLSKAKAGDQISGLSLDNAIICVKEAARLHSSFWDIASGQSQGWLDAGEVSQPFYTEEVLTKSWPIFHDRYADIMSKDMIMVCEALSENYSDYIKPLARPRCVTHNDFRPDNILFCDGRAYVVDWQSCAIGYNAVDVSFLIGGSFGREDRKLSESRLLSAYHEELINGGVAGYSLSDLSDDYRHFSFAGINVSVGAAVMVNRTERGDRMFLTMLQRHVEHVLDSGALDILSGHKK